MKIRHAAVLGVIFALFSLGLVYGALRSAWRKLAMRQR